MHHHIHARAAFATFLGVLLLLAMTAMAMAQSLSPGDRARPGALGNLTISGSITGAGLQAQPHGVNVAGGYYIGNTPLQLQLGAGLTSSLGACNVGPAQIGTSASTTIYPQVCPVSYASAHVVLAGEMGSLLVATGTSSVVFTLPAVGTPGFQSGQSVCFTGSGSGGFQLASASPIDSGPTQYAQDGSTCATADTASGSWHVVGGAGGALADVYLLGPEFTVSAGQLDITSGGISAGFLGTGAALGNIGTNGIALSYLSQIGSKKILGNATGSTANIAAAYTASNATDTTIPLVHGATTAGHCTQFNDTTGTIVDSGGACGGTGGSTSVISGTNITVSSSPCTTSCTVSMATQAGVTAGTYNNANVTVDGTGTITGITAGTAQASTALFCDGSDGALVSGFGTVTLSRDACYSNITWGATDQIITDGFKLMVNGTCNMAAAGQFAIVDAAPISLTGNASPGVGPGVAPASAPSGTVPSAAQIGGAGASGGTGAGVVGTTGAPPPIAYYGGVISSGGAGGAGASAGGVGPTNAPSGANKQASAYPLANFVAFNNGYVGALTSGSNGAGGGSGSGDGTHFGGGGGGGGGNGGTTAVYCGVLARGTNTNTEIISAQGGPGGAGGNAAAAGTNSGGGGGGGGGPGGHVFLVVGSLTGSTITNGLDASGGAGGNGGNGVGATGHGGHGGSSGTGGAIEVINVGAGTYTATPPNTLTNAGSAGATGGTDTGGAGGALFVQQQNLRNREALDTQAPPDHDSISYGSGS